MGWLFRRASESFEQYRDMWDELNRAQVNHPLLDSMFVGPLIRYFASERILLGISNDSKNPGIALVECMRKGFWSTFQPSQAPLGLLLFANKDALEGQISLLTRSLPSRCFAFSILQQDPDVVDLEDLNLSNKIEILDYIQIARLNIKENFENYWESRGKNLVHNLSRQHRRLAERGTHIELVEDRVPARVATLMQEYGRLESLGWKQLVGTAVNTDNQQGLFYQEILENFCSRGEGVIYRLLMDGKTVASDLCLHRNGMMIILKTAYDESVKGLSLGLLMHYEIFKLLFFEKKIKIVEFYGQVRDWHTKWTKDIRTMYHVNFYRYGWLGTSRRALKYGMRAVAG